MVDVSEKTATKRLAVSSGRIFLKPDTITAIKEGRISKGDTLAVAEIACIQAIKKTHSLIPLCHNIPIGGVDAEFTIGRDYIEASCKVMSYGKTGVEMEALTGVSIALLTIWDMVKYLEKDSAGQYPETKIMDIRVIEKRR
jgi:cyclic pyranopterin phosphate synthase